MSLLLTLNIFLTFFSVFIADFERVNICWVAEWLFFLFLNGKIFLHVENLTLVNIFSYVKYNVKSFFKDHEQFLDLLSIVCLLLYRKLLGRFYFLSAGILPGFFSSLAAISIERKSRRGALAIYMLNQVIRWILSMHILCGIHDFRISFLKLSEIKRIN